AAGRGTHARLQVARRRSAACPPQCRGEARAGVDQVAVRAGGEPLQGTAIAAHGPRARRGRAAAPASAPPTRAGNPAAVTAHRARPERHRASSTAAATPTAAVTRYG